MPLAILPPPMSNVNNSHLIYAHFEKKLLKLSEINEGETMRALQAMSKQMSCLIKYHNFNLRPPPHESNKHFLGLWCTTCKQVGHMAQFCVMGG
jgi:hypothetical protein